MDMKVTLTAHRGYRQKFPENTMISFREALKLDIDAIEMDTRMTADRQMVVIHDETLDRTTDMTGYICDKTLDEVRKADAGIKFGEEFKGEKVPTLDEFIALMATRPDIKLLLELKDYPEISGDFAYVSCEKALGICKKYGVWGKDRLTVITFSTGICSWLRHRYTREDFSIHGFYPKGHMRGSESDHPYKYYDEVCLFGDVWDMDGKRSRNTHPVVSKEKVQDFVDMGIRPCAYYRFNTDETIYREAYENGIVGFTCDDAYTCGMILDKLGARKLKK